MFTKFQRWLIWFGLITVATWITAGLAFAMVSALMAPPKPQQPKFEDVYTWCVNRYPNYIEMQEACKTGAYEMLQGNKIKEDK